MRVVTAAASSFPASWRKRAMVLALSGIALAGGAVHAHAQEAAASPAVAMAAPTAVLPGDDFYDYVNGDWLRSTEIPVDRSSWGSFAILANATNERIIALVEGLAAAPQADASARQVSDFTVPGSMKRLSKQKAGRRSSRC
ncbi:Peptidase family M13 [Janthinobacterium lividum]|nr:M13 family metallopeptidase [Janthinobacterium lividum]STQ93571.1 Peptidase family M13 [Janthinobacterium lividum]